MSSSVAQQEGFLMLKKTGLLKGWNKRWCVLDSNRLTCYKNRSDVGVKFAKQVEVTDILGIACVVRVNVASTLP